MDPANVIHEEASMHSDKQEDIVRRELKKPKLVSYLWDTFDKPAEERRLLKKLDAAIISFASIGKWMSHYLHNFY
jgi:hypothetical protein